MSRLTLIVKGCAPDAVSAAHEHGIAPQVLRHNTKETILAVPVSDYSKVVGWYAEQTELIAGFGYGVGTLLTFAEIGEVADA